MTWYLIRIVRFDFRRTNWVDLLQGVGTEVGVGCVAINPVWLEFLDSISATRKKATQKRQTRQNPSPSLCRLRSISHSKARRKHVPTMYKCTN